MVDYGVKRRNPKLFRVTSTKQDEELPPVITEKTVEHVALSMSDNLSPRDSPAPHNDQDRTTYRGDEVCFGCNGG